ncbi:hypothetical protein NT1RE_03740 [Agrobacterium fabrum]|uniref:hypothetical protein n=1 Tax=Agrobacterium fabrum TaxID=1176649 RepID=UPI00138DE970|nr:hypothetical protein [Agrobacterium fabrum]MCX2874406.1 hypothetical protein [Agrobacterium fabrum]QQN06133.1 hypothetical protein EML4058_02160 [Agrobacterium fabrum]QQN11198.1 hypothetical protein EML540_02170 [Agrobacterium fabrum]QQN16380.1 hypothetical protein EML485_02155 [Agrobacterium fabrum]UOG25769.1 hypothetical protein KXJ62_03715 [Agrobacterium fabrum]
MKNCLSNVAEIARNHDIFGPIDERISNPVQAVSDFYTAFSGNIGKLGFKVENLGSFTISSPRKIRRHRRIAFHRPCLRLSFFVVSQVVNGTSPSYPVCDERKAFALPRFSTKTNPLVLNGAVHRRPVSGLENYVA